MEIDWTVASGQCLVIRKSRSGIQKEVPTEIERRISVLTEEALSQWA
jgi:hypothetical protein